MTEAERLQLAMDALVAIYALPDRAAEIAAQTLKELDASDERVPVDRDQFGLPEQWNTAPDGSGISHKIHDPE